MNQHPLLTDPISLAWADRDNRVLGDPDPTSESSADVACGTSNATLGERVERFEQEIIENTLRRRGGHRQATAKELGISRVTLYNKMKKFGLLAPEPAAADGPESPGTAATNFSE